MDLVRLEYSRTNSENFTSFTLVLAMLQHFPFLAVISVNGVFWPLCVNGQVLWTPESHSETIKKGSGAEANPGFTGWCVSRESSLKWTVPYCKVHVF